MAQSVPTFAVPYAAGYLAKKIFGNAPVVIPGIRSIPAESVPLVCINGLQPSAFAVIAGRRILTGTLEFLPQLKAVPLHILGEIHNHLDVCFCYVASAVSTSQTVYPVGLG